MGVPTTTSTMPAACAGVTAVMVVLLTTFTAVAGTPAKVTEVAPVNPVPVMVTPNAPDAEPLAGLIPISVTPLVTVISTPAGAVLSPPTVIVVCACGVAAPRVMVQLAPGNREAVQVVDSTLIPPTGRVASTFCAATVAEVLVAVISPV